MTPRGCLILLAGLGIAAGGCAKKKVPDLTKVQVHSRYAPVSIQGKSALSVGSLGVAAVPVAVVAPGTEMAVALLPVGTTRPVVPGGPRPAPVVAKATAPAAGVALSTAVVAAPPVPPVGAAPVEPAARVPREFQYNDRVRDPFQPLLGDLAAGMPFGEGTPGTAGPAINVGALSLKGIVQDPVRRFALLSDAAGGSYVVRDGKLLDNRGQEVRGVTGFVKERSVVLTTVNKLMREIHLDQGGSGLTAPSGR